MDRLTNVILMFVPKNILRKNVENVDFLITLVNLKFIIVLNIKINIITK